MGMDVDYIAGKQAIDKLEKLFGDLQHGERNEFADEIIEFVENMNIKYKKDDDVDFDDEDKSEILGYQCLGCGNIQDIHNGFGCDKCHGHSLSPWYE